jgi:hypothetical protein
MWIHSAFGKCTYKRCWKWCPRASIKAWTRLILFANTFCTSAFGKSLYTYKRCWKWCPRASVQAWTKYTYRSLRAQRLSERAVHYKVHERHANGHFCLLVLWFKKFRRHYDPPKSRKQFTQRGNNSKMSLFFTNSFVAVPKYRTLITEF